MKCLAALLLLNIVSQYIEGQKTGIFEGGKDIGNPEKKGLSVYVPEDQSYTIKGAGYNIWFDRDEFYYLYSKLKGDFLVTASFEFKAKGKEPHRKTGWMIRETLDDNSSHITGAVHGDGLTVLQWRVSAGAQMRDPHDEIFAADSGFNVIQLERQGKTITMRAAHAGKPFVIIGSRNMENMPDEVFAGPFICSHNPQVVEEVRLWNVRIDKTVPDNYDPEKSGYLGSRMEIINIADSKRKVIWEKPGRFEAPNWMPDGKRLLFNMDGLIYTIPVNGGKTAQINTGKVRNNNNDHGISFNGRMLAISSAKPEGGESAVWILPVTGGEPKLLTAETPSYFHGWSPDNTEVVYVAKRDGKTVYNIYKKPVEGGKETALTNIEAGQHVDGCEFSPDGKYIYYNGNHTGKMQIWRMKPDGSGRQQLTFDEYNNWFPHVSPNGKLIVFLSYPPDTDPNSHPSYKRVMLRTIPVNIGEPKIIAYLYGGQGTINVPSWSPDSKQVAFVSNSGK
jgi:Tol biopolymer transport system component